VTPTPPQTIGKYQIIREIARSNDIVYEAYDPAMNRRVAIKELNIPGGSSDPQRLERIRRFEREVKAAGSLAHPSIVTIYEVEEDAGRHYMAMEYLDGKTLRNEIDTTGLLPTQRALEITLAVLEALAFAHEHGVIHRDIKPENIQLLSSGRVKLTDFGIARLTFEPNITIDGQVFGTPSYMSPEQVVGKEIDARSDLFSVGAVLFEMLGGQKAFPGDSVVSISYAIMNTEPVIPASASNTVQELLRNLLNKSVSQRYSNANVAIAAVRAALLELTSGAVMAPPPVVAAAPAFPAQAYSYGYNPPPQAPMQLPPGPIFIPPHRMPPMLKPETKLAIARVCGIAITLGLILGIIVVGVQSMLQAANRAAYGQVRSATPSPPEAAQGDAVKWSANAEQHAMMGNFAEAIRSVEAAIKIDPGQVGYFVQLGEYQRRLAELSLGAENQANLWINSAESYAQAVQMVMDDPARQDRYREQAASARYNAAVLLLRLRDRTGARTQLTHALALAPEGSHVRRLAEELLNSLS